MDRRLVIIIAFALRYLDDNLDDETEGALNDRLNDANQPSLINDEELGEIATGLEG